MLHVACSVYDSKALYYMPPFFVKTDMEAKRLFGLAVSDPKSTLSQFAADYTLYRVGTFDDSSGAFQSETPVFVSNGAEFTLIPARSVEEDG